MPTVDGADNRDNAYGGPLMSYTVEGLEQFQLSTSLFNATDGRGAGAALQMVTKSGTNQLHGSAFGYERDRKLSAKDYFTKRAGTDKVPFSRQQYGGSVGGPIKQDKVWFFASFREWGSERQGAGKFWNLTQGTMFYTPDPDRPATGYEWYESKATRVTWRASERNKFNFFADVADEDQR